MLTTIPTDISCVSKHSKYHTIVNNADVRYNLNMEFQLGLGILRVLGWPCDDVPGGSTAAAAEFRSLRLMMRKMRR